MGGGPAPLNEHLTNMTISTSSKKQLVLILTNLYPSASVIIPQLQKTHLPKDKYEIKHYPNTMGGTKPEDQPTPEEWNQAIALMTFQFPSNIKSIDQMKNLKLVQLSSAGYAHIEGMDLYKQIPKENPIAFASAAGIHVVPIAEHVIATTLSLLHNLPRYTLASNAKPPQWISGTQVGKGGFVVKELRERVLGVLGYGHIGREVARMAKSLGMQIIAATRSGSAAKIGGYLIPGTGDIEGTLPSEYYSTSSKSSMTGFYAKCDVVVNTLPASKGTIEFVDEKAFRDMKDDAVYVNIGRGDTTDQNALISALEASHNRPQSFIAPKSPSGNLCIGFASLDVTTPEPLPVDSPLWSLTNCMITPHCSGSSELYWVRASDLFGVNIHKVVEKGEGGLNVFRGKGEDL